MLLKNVVFGCALGLSVCMAPKLSMAAGEEEGKSLPAAVPEKTDKVINWRQYPVPHGEPETTQPPDEAFLAVLPTLREAPAFSKEVESLGVAVWWGDYSRHIFSEQPPGLEDLKREPLVRTTAGEDEPLVLGLWGIRSLQQATLVVKQSPFPVTIRHVEFSPRYVPGGYFGYEIKGGRRVGFATYLPLRATAQIEAGKNAVFWLTVRTPRDASPGRYEMTLHLTVHGKKELQLPVTVEVLDYVLPPRADIAFGMYFRPSATTMTSRYVGDKLLRAYWRDMAEHGMTTATLYNYNRFHDKDGNVNLQGHPIVATIEAMMAEGLLSPDIPAMLLDGGGIDLKADFAPEVARTLQEAAEKRGWPRFLLYGPDEPGVNEKSLAAFMALQPLRQYMPIVTAISAHSVSVYADLLDAWVVNAGRTSPEIQDLAARKGAELWNYTCHNRGHGNPPFNRFYAGIYTWALRLKGNLIWAYTEGFSWEGDRNSIYCWVLPSDTGPVPSVAWEARREGVEDYRVLRLLESRIADSPDHPVSIEAKSWLNTVRDRVDWYLARNMPPSLYPWDGPELYPLCPNFTPPELGRVRAKAEGYITKLK